MPGNTKSIVKDLDSKPAPQYFNPEADAYEYLQGKGGGHRVLLYGPDGNPIVTAAPADGLANPSKALAALALLQALNTDATPAWDRLRAIAGDADNTAATLKALLTAARLYGFDGTDWDRLKATAGVLHTLLANVEGSPGAAAPAKAAYVAGTDGTNLRGLAVTSAGELKAQLTGSSVPDSQALPTTPAQKDVVARAIDSIIKEIGLDNIACFLPMWETGGSELRDLVHPDLKFRVFGATPGVVGPFGSAWSLDGVDDAIEQAPALETATGTGEAALDAAGKMLAQRIKPNSIEHRISHLGLYLRKVGAPSGDLIVEIRTDASGVPSSTVVATSLAQAATRVPTSANWLGGFGFSSPVNLDLGSYYWIVLKWATGATVDASNHVRWVYDTTGAYGEPRASFDGTTWTATSGQSHAFRVFHNLLHLSEWTYIAAGKRSGGSSSVIVGHYATASDPRRHIVVYPSASWVTDNWQFLDRADGGAFGVSTDAPRVWDRYFVAAMTFSTSASTDKLVAYLNGRKLASSSGTAGAASAPASYPLWLGHEAPQGSRTNFYQGHLGGLIVARVPLTQQQVAAVTRHILALRYYGVAGV